MAYSSSDEKDTQDFSFLESEGLPNYFFETQTGVSLLMKFFYHFSFKKKKSYLINHI